MVESARGPRARGLNRPRPGNAALIWFAREAWPSPAAGTRITEGTLSDSLDVVVESEALVAFGDGIESDHLSLNWGQQVSIGLAPEKLRLALPR